MTTDEHLHCFGVLAVELTPQTQAQQTVLDQQAVAVLADHIASDLAKFTPKAGQLDLALIGAHFDPVEILRPRWPVHMALLQLAERAPKSLNDSQGRIIAFGAQAGSSLPRAVTPDPEHIGGPLRLLPFALIGAASFVQQVGAELEERLLDTGMTGAATALHAQELFAAPIEHARYLTVYDLLAMTAMQYQHAGLEPLWPLLESALFDQASTAWLDQPPEPLICLKDGQAHIAMLDIDGWIGHGFASAQLLPAQLNTSFEHFQARQRQLCAVLRAHGIDVTFDFCGSNHDPRRMLADT